MANTTKNTKPFFHWHSTKNHNHNKSKFILYFVYPITLVSTSVETFCEFFDSARTNWLKFSNKTFSQIWTYTSGKINVCRISFFNKEKNEEKKSADFIVLSSNKNVFKNRFVKYIYYDSASIQFIFIYHFTKIFIIKEKCISNFQLKGEHKFTIYIFFKFSLATS